MTPTQTFIQILAEYAPAVREYFQSTQKFLMNFYKI